MIRVIIIDDHQLVIDGVRHMIEQDPEIEIVGTAGNGREAIKLVQLLKVDVALMDIDMPEMNGVEAAKEILPNHPDVKVIIVSMHNEKGLITELMKMGIHGFLIKNSGQEELLQAIKTVHGGKKFFSEEVSMSLIGDDEPEKNDLLADLTSREKEVLGLIAEGLSNKEIGEKLFISHRTVEAHRRTLMEKLGTKKVVDLLRIAIRSGLVD